MSLGAGPLNLDSTTHRQFVAENYNGIKQANPNLPFLVREANGVQPRIFARFGMCITAFAINNRFMPLMEFHSLFIDKGVERKVTLENASVQDVKNALENLAKSN